VKPESGDIDYLLGRKNKLGNVVRFYLILFCRLPDMWFWHLHASDNYNVTSAYNYML